LVLVIITAVKEWSLTDSVGLFDRVGQNNMVTGWMLMKTGLHCVYIVCIDEVACVCIGASDDTVSCSIMLEVLHVMSHDPSPHRHCVMFIFNGAEENIVQVF